MTLEQIKAAVSAGREVHWKSPAYRVVLDKFGQFFIFCTFNANAIKLTWTDGVTMNGMPQDFYEV